jgi:hypothetical protein
MFYNCLITSFFLAILVVLVFVNARIAVSVTLPPSNQGHALQAIGQLHASQGINKETRIQIEISV